MTLKTIAQSNMTSKNFPSGVSASKTTRHKRSFKLSGSFSSTPQSLIVSSPEHQKSLIAKNRLVHYVQLS